MAKLAAFAILLLFSLAEISIASAKKPPAAAARREDVPFIRCQVCEKIAEQIHDQIKKKQSQISPKKVSEYQIIEIAENVCNLKKEEADWILQIDIVENGDKLELVDQGTEGQCNSECKTIERACQEIMGYSDTDVAEYVYKHQPSINKLVNFLCKDLSKACSVKPPPVPKNRIPGEPFVAKSAKDAEMEKIMRSMEGMPGAPSMKMYSRDEMMKNMNNLGDGDGDEDDGDDEDDFPGKLGNILKQKEHPKTDMKQKVLQSVKDAGSIVRGHFDKVSKQVRNWWSGKKTGAKSRIKRKSEL